MKFKDFLASYFDLLFWWIHVNLIFAVQASEKTDNVWYAVLQSKYRSGVYMRCTQIVLCIVQVV